MADESSSYMIGLTDEATQHMATIRKWAAFLSILGFICVGLMVLFAFSFGFLMNFAGTENELSRFPALFATVFYVVLAGVYFFPIFYLYQFSVHAKNGLGQSDVYQLTIAMKYLKSHYVFIGVMAIVALALVPIGIALAVIIALANR